MSLKNEARTRQTSRVPYRMFKVL